MAKTVLKTVLMILVLAGVFFFALQFYERKKAAPPQEGEKLPETPAVSVRQISVFQTAEGATVQIVEVPGPGYTISPLVDGGSKGFLVDVTGAQIALLETQKVNPHPLISMIQASQISAQGQPHSRIRVELTQEATYTDRLQGTSLFIDIVAKLAATPTPNIEPTVTPRKAPVISRKVERKKVTPKKVASRHRTRPLPAPVKKATPVEPPEFTEPEFTAPEPAPAPAEKVAEAPTLPSFAEPPPSAPPAQAAPKVTDPSAPLDLDALFAETKAEQVPEAPPEVPPTEAPPVVAALPPSSGKFDTKQVLENLPALKELTVTNEGGTTLVKIEREAKMAFKIFKMVNPNRITIEFKNSVNHLKPTYAAVPGTRVQKITTSQFAGPEGTISRVMVFIDGLPAFDKTVEGNTFVLKLP